MSSWPCAELSRRQVGGAELAPPNWRHRVVLDRPPTVDTSFASELTSNMLSIESYCMTIDSIRWVVPMSLWHLLTSVWLVLRNAQIARAISSVNISLSVAIFMSRCSLHVSGNTSSTYTDKSTFNWHQYHMNNLVWYISPKCHYLSYCECMAHRMYRMQRWGLLLPM